MHTPDIETTDTRWQSLYIVGAGAALISVLLVLLDIGISIWLPHGDAAPGARSASDWFLLLQSNRYYGFRDLGLLNILNILLGLPLLLALYAVHQRVNPGYSTLTIAVFVLGGAVYVSNNAMLPLVVLSQKYVAATTDAQRSALVAAGEALLARGADFTLGSLLGFLLVSLAHIAMSAVMLHSGIFSKVTAATGLIGFALLLIFTIWTTCAPASFDRAMLLAFPGGLLAVVWNILVARTLFRLAHVSTPRSARPDA